jgi:hypothetical protein
MILNFRGTSGAGKSFLVRELMALFGPIEPIHIPARRQPIGYDCGGKLYVLGHYETACGGCDTISVPGAMDYVYKEIRDWHAKGRHILYEGVIVQDDTKRAIQLHKDGRPLTVVFLTTPLADCLAGIQARRDARGDSRPLDPTNTRNRIPRLKKHAQNLKAAGVPVLELSRADALAKCRELLGVL